MGKTYFPLVNMRRQLRVGKDTTGRRSNEPLALALSSSEKAGLPKRTLQHPKATADCNSLFCTPYIPFYFFLVY